MLNVLSTLDVGSGLEVLVALVEPDFSEVRGKKVVTGCFEVHGLLVDFREVPSLMLVLVFLAVWG